MDHEKNQRLIETLAKDQKERRQAKNLAKHATRSDRMVLLLARQLHAHYEERSRSPKEGESDLLLFGIVFACYRLIEDLESYEKTPLRRKSSGVGGLESYESDRQIAEHLAKSATQSDRLVTLLVRELRTHYKERSLKMQWHEGEVFILRIALSCLHLSDALDNLEAYAKIQQSYKSADERHKSTDA